VSPRYTDLGGSVGPGADAKFLVQSNVSTNVLIDIVGYYL